MTFAAFLNANKNEILAEWATAVRKLPTAHDLPDPVLLDTVPQLLDAIGAAMATDGPFTSAIAVRLAEKHAAQRLDRGFDLPQAITECCPPREP